MKRRRTAFVKIGLLLALPVLLALAGRAWAQESAQPFLQLKRQPVVQMTSHDAATQT